VGYPFLREAIAQGVYAQLGISSDEIFISDGINSDITDIFDLFDANNQIALPNPAYPAYYHAAIIGGRKERTFELPCIEETGFLPIPPERHCDIAVLCSPHNPTGVA